MNTTRIHTTLALLFLLFSLLISEALQAQEISIRRQTLSKTGGPIGSTDFFIQQSIGQESTIGSFSGAQLNLHQGFIQPLYWGFGKSQSTDLQLTLYPNPFNDFITIAFEDIVQNDVFIVISDLTGREIYSNRFSAAQKIDLSLSWVSTGLYVIRISTRERSFSGQIQKLEL